MKEDQLRESIRTEIYKSLEERSYIDRAKRSVSDRLGRVANLAGVRLLKKALAQGSTDQRAAGVLAVMKELIGNDSAVLRKIRYRLQNKATMGSADTGEEV